MNTTIAGPHPDRDRVQRRVLAVLVAAQILSGAGLAAGITVGALLAQDMLGSTRWAGLPSALFTVGSAAAAAGVGRISQRSGRRAGLTVGYLVGAVGSFGVVLAAVAGNVALLFTAFLVYGAGTATSLQARYAGADLARSAHRARAISTVLVATTVGAVAGPNLVTVMSNLAEGWGIPPLSGPFVLSGLAYVLAGTVLWALLRPDPLQLARADAPAEDPTTAATDTIEPRRTPAPVVLGATIMVLTQLVMVAIMTMTPIHMQHHGHSVGAAGFVIAIHVAGMYLPSLLSECWSTDSEPVVSRWPRHSPWWPPASPQPWPRHHLWPLWRSRSGCSVWAGTWAWSPAPPCSPTPSPSPPAPAPRAPSTCASP